MTEEDYRLLKESGMFWELYPELTGEWELDREWFERNRSEHE